MTVQMTEWLRVLDAEYLARYIPEGGGAVKFVVAPGGDLRELDSALRARATKHGLLYVHLDGSLTRIHLMQDLFFCIARQVSWADDAQRFVEGVFQIHGYSWPVSGTPYSLSDLAKHHHVDPLIMGKELRQWLKAAIMDDTSMAQDFRVALMQVCLQRVTPSATADTPHILEWLRGELKTIGPLKSALIYSKVTRHNARIMLKSLSHWLRLVGYKGILLTIDIRCLAKTAAMLEGGFKYTTGAVLDAYEVLRQLVDDAEDFEGLLAVIASDETFIGNDPKRSVDAYSALKMRIWDDVRARVQDNPLAPLVVFGPVANESGPEVSA